jgi:hypothetical protein
MSDWYYDIATLEHFWVRRRFDVMRRMADPLIRKAASIAEFGCGNGMLQRCVEDHYGLSVSGFELNEGALKRNVSRSSSLYCYDIHHRVPEFRARFDLLLLCDVLEHIEDESAFLQSIRYHLTGSGIMVINVPAHQYLFSKYDKEAGHFRRYSMARLKKVVEQNGFRVRSATYWGLCLVPLLLARKVIVSMKHTEGQAYSTGFDPGGRWSNMALGLLARCEPIPQRLQGTSVMAVVENQP